MQVPNPDVKKVLKKALALIRKGWTKGALCRDKDKVAVKYHVGLREKGCKFCSLGAIDAGAELVKLTDYSAAIFEAKQKLREALPVRTGIIAWNDSPDRRKPEVVAAFQAAIKSLD
jgi:hypothetical protein